MPSTLTFRKPLTFVTSIFGMTNMPAEPAPYWPFAITLAAICVPFFSIIGFLSTNYGYHVWATKTRQLWHWIRPRPKVEEESETEYTGQTRMSRSMSTEEGMRMRIRDREPLLRRSMSRPPPSHPNIQAMVARMGEGRQSGLTRMGTVMESEEADTDAGSSGRTTKDTIINIREP
jgi:hypothetical protein